MYRAVCLIICALICDAISTSQVLAWPFSCTEPDEPYCLKYPFESSDEADICRLKVRSYIDGVSDYTKCLNGQIKDATDKAEDVVKRFNCKARGGGVC